MKITFPLSTLCCVLAAACGPSSSPAVPSASRSASQAPPDVTAVSVSTVGSPSIFGASVDDLARCLQSSGDAACFSGARSVERVVAGAAAPGAPGNLVATASGSTVTLTWTAPASDDPVVTYVIEAGSASGLANLAVVTTNSTATTFSASGVGDGTYYVRLRARNAAGTGAASNEAILVVGAAACTSAPNAPSGLTSTVTSGTITLSWNAPSAGCAPTSYMLQAGSTSGSSALANSSVGNVTRFVATGVGSGSYYIRVVAANAFGQSAASNEIVATVALLRGALSVAVTPNPTPFSGAAFAFCPGNPNTWTYSETIQETNGVGMTVLQRSYSIDGQFSSQAASNLSIPARGSVALNNLIWCRTGPGPYTVQTTYIGTDANGNSFSYAGPTVTLQAKPGTTNKRTFPAVWITASWSGGATGTPLSSRGIDPLTHFGTLCLANSITLKNHPGGLFAGADDTLFATNTGCSAAMTTVAFCRTSGSGGGASSIPTCAIDPRETPFNNLRIVAVSRLGVGTPVGTTPINFDVNVFWCSDQSTFNYDRRVSGKPLMECIED